MMMSSWACKVFVCVDRVHDEDIGGLAMNLDLVLNCSRASLQDFGLVST